MAWISHHGWKPPSAPLLATIGSNPRVFRRVERKITISDSSSTMSTFFFILYSCSVTFYRLMLAANRDEYYDRPTEPLGFWDDNPYILGGRDLRSKGSWLGVTLSGRLAAVTNFRERGSLKKNAPSRGLLVSAFLVGRKSPQDYLELVRSIGHKYNGFNLLVGDHSGLFYYSNKGNNIYRIKYGLYGLSNHLLNTPWPKVEKGKDELRNLFAKEKVSFEELLDTIGNQEYPPDDQLPDTGVGHEWEKLLSPLFVTSESYGTRSSSIVLFEKKKRITFLERNFIRDDKGEIRDYDTRKFSFSVISS
ncbi:NRDE family protein [Desulfococcaceae bacterium HSG8]|nr:NRDE family protein [Desulfococcaceae bacterium HSG8]